MKDAVRGFDDVSGEVPPVAELRASGLDAMSPGIGVAESDQSNVYGIVEPGGTSAVLGLSGLTAMLLLLAGAVPLEILWVEEVLSASRGEFYITCAVFMMVFIPASTTAVLAICTVMFWHVSLVLRFVIAVAMFVPAVILFTVLMSYLQEGGLPSERTVAGTSALFSAVFVAAGSVGLLFQLCTPWTLTHLRRTDQELPRLGIRTLLELMTILAMSFAFVSALESVVPIGATLAFAAVAGVGSLLGIGSCIAFMRQKPISKISLVAGFVGAFLMSFATVACAVTAVYGWQGVLYQAHVTVPLGLFGAVFVIVPEAACIYWLRLCGWRCVR